MGEGKAKGTREGDEGKGKERGKMEAVNFVQL